MNVEWTYEGNPNAFIDWQVGIDGSLTVIEGAYDGMYKVA